MQGYLPSPRSGAKRIGRRILNTNQFFLAQINEITISQSLTRPSVTSSEASSVCMSPEHKGWYNTEKLTCPHNLLAQLNPKYECFNLYETPLTYASLTVVRPGHLTYMEQLTDGLA